MRHTSRQPTLLPVLISVGLRSVRSLVPTFYDHLIGLIKGLKCMMSWRVDGDRQSTLKSKTMPVRKSMVTGYSRCVKSGWKVVVSSSFTTLRNPLIDSRRVRFLPFVTIKSVRKVRFRFSPWPVYVDEIVQERPRPCTHTQKKGFLQ